MGTVAEETLTLQRRIRDDDCTLDGTAFSKIDEQVLFFINSKQER
jgi:hypothetical protein